MKLIFYTIEIENKLLALKKSLQEKQKSGNWDTIIRESPENYNI